MSPARDRQQSLDMLRGVAVFGIFIINCTYTALPDVRFDTPRYWGGDGLVNHGLWFVNNVIVQSTMMGMFAVLFGAGIVLFTARAAGPDGPIRVADLYYRRTLWLAVFGLIHTYGLLWGDDILFVYSLAGLMLFPFRVLAPRTLIWLSVAILALALIDSYLSTAPRTALLSQAESIMSRPDATPLNDAEAATLAAFEDFVAGQTPPADLAEQGRNAVGPMTVPEFYAANAEGNRLSRGLGNMLFRSVRTAGLMLIGMALFKWGFLSASFSVRVYLLFALVAYFVGLPLRVWEGSAKYSLSVDPLLASWPYFGRAANIAMTLGHIGILLALYKSFVHAALVRWLAAVGRMALTNYIMQSVIAVFVFGNIGIATGWGLGLTGLFERWQIWLFMIAVWIFQTVFSVWWLRRYRFGPLEWVWRSLTYWQRQPMRRAG